MQWLYLEGRLPAVVEKGELRGKMFFLDHPTIFLSRLILGALIIGLCCAHEALTYKALPKDVTHSTNASISLLPLLKGRDVPSLFFHARDEECPPETPLEVRTILSVFSFH